MNLFLKVLAVCWGLTEEQLKEITGEGKLDDADECKTVELKIGQVFGNEDQNTTKISAVHVVLALKRLAPVLRKEIIDAIIEIGRAFPSQETSTAAQDAELQRAVDAAAGEGMGTARPSTQAKGATPSARPWTPDDKIPN
ncbi:MAG: hypothetical protein Q7R85_00785 [bacterium]|nr:hypothetical protein [bacterium]